MQDAPAGGRSRAAGLGAGDPGGKRRLYQARGVTGSWVVDADARLVQVWLRDAERSEVVNDELRWQVAPGRRSW